MTLENKWIRIAGRSAFLTIFDDDGEREVRASFHFEICPSCQGTGATSRHVEADGGGFTASEWAELDWEFKEDYLAGNYDRPCKSCQEYPGRVPVLDISTLNPEDRKAWRKQVQDEYEYQQMCEMERRYGA